MAAPQVVLADLASASAGANVIGTGIRSRWDQTATVEVTDAPDGKGGTESAFYVSKSLNNAWRRQDAIIGTMTGDEDGPYIVIPK